MQIHLINLDRDADRLAKYREINPHLQDIVRPYAVPGRELNKIELQRAGMIMPDLRYNDSSLGNAHSHIMLWEKAVRTATQITVSEDDAIFVAGFKSAAESLLGTLPSDWDFVQWGWNYDAFLWVEMPAGVSGCKISCDQDELRKNLDRFRSSTVASTLLRLRHSFGIMGYTISPKGAAELLRLCLPLRDTLIDFPGFNVTIENLTIDAMMNFAYPKIKAFVAVPPLVVSENRAETSNTRRNP